MLNSTNMSPEFVNAVCKLALFTKFIRFSRCVLSGKSLISLHDSNFLAVVTDRLNVIIRASLLLTSLFDEQRHKHAEESLASLKGFVSTLSGTEI